MTSIRAIQLIKGQEEGSANDILEAWQYAYDTGMIYRMEGWYGRKMLSLINAGRIKTNVKSI